MSINLDAIKARLAEVHAAGVSGVTVRLADYGLRVTVQMRSWDGTTAHDGYEAVTHLLGNAPADIAALVAEVERLREHRESCTENLLKGYETGKTEERAAVVAWLRECALDSEATGAEMRLLQEHATRIERGEHRHEEET